MMTTSNTSRKILFKKGETSIILTLNNGNLEFATVLKNDSPVCVSNMGTASGIIAIIEHMMTGGTWEAYTVNDKGEKEEYNSGVIQAI